MKYDGKCVAKLIETDIISKINVLNIQPHLAIILIGNRPDSELYVSLKIKKCNELGINHTLIQFDENISEDKVINQIKNLNINKNIHGILVQLPLPIHLNTQNILNHIDEFKDVDCLTSANLGKFFMNNSRYYPCTPKAIMEILTYYNIDVQGKIVCVVGSGNVGKGISFLLLQNEATVISTNRYTPNLKQFTLQADIIISCCGQPLMIKEDFIKENVHIIDVGISKIEDKKTKSGFRTVGDVDYDKVSKKANVNKLTVGPVTIMILMKQLIDSAMML